MSKTHIVAGLALVFLLAGCGKVVTAGQPAPTQQTAGSVITSSAPPPRSAATISPCNDLTPQQITGMGLDPTTKSNQDLNSQPYEHGCTWKNKDVLVSIFATNATVAGYENQTRFLNRQHRTVAGLPSLSFQTDPHPDGCSLISNIPGGGLVVQIDIRTPAGLPGGMDACTATVKYMEQAAPLLLK